MRSKLLFSVFFLIGMVFIFAALQADTTTEVRSGTVTSVQGNHVVIKMSTGEEKEFDVPDDFRLTVDGKEISVHELKPGTKLSRTITTTTEPKTVYTTTVKKGVVWHAQGDTVIITGADGKNRQYNHVPDWITFNVDGKDMDVMELKKGMRVTATIVSDTPSTVVTSMPGGVSGNAPAAPAAAAAPAAEPAPAAAAEPAPAPEKKTLPKTASNIELLALLGVGLLLLSWKIR
jgi:hypothetical protein